VITAGVFAATGVDMFMYTTPSMYRPLEATPCVRILGLGFGGWELGSRV
jgi:hypothetical protein